MVGRGGLSAGPRPQAAVLHRTLEPVDHRWVEFAGDG